MTRAHRRVRPQSDADGRGPRLRVRLLRRAAAAAGQFKFCGFLPSSFVSCPMSDGASETDEMTDFHRNRFAAGRPAGQTTALRHFRPLQLFSFDWNSRHAAFKKSLIGVPSSPDSITFTSSHAPGGSRPPVMRFPSQDRKEPS